MTSATGIAPTTPRIAISSDATAPEHDAGWCRPARLGRPALRPRPVMPKPQLHLLAAPYRAAGKIPPMGRPDHSGVHRGPSRGNTARCPARRAYHHTVVPACHRSPSSRKAPSGRPCDGFERKPEAGIAPIKTCPGVISGSYHTMSSQSSPETGQMLYRIQMEPESGARKTCTGRLGDINVGSGRRHWVRTRAGGFRPVPAQRSRGTRLPCRSQPGHGPVLP